MKRQKTTYMICLTRDWRLVTGGDPKNAIGPTFLTKEDVLLCGIKPKIWKQHKRAWDHLLWLERHYEGTDPAYPNGGMFTMVSNVTPEEHYEDWRYAAFNS